MTCACVRHSQRGSNAFGRAALRVARADGQATAQPPGRHRHDGAPPAHFGFAWLRREVLTSCAVGHPPPLTVTADAVGGDAVLGRFFALRSRLHASPRRGPPLARARGADGPGGAGGAVVGGRAVGAVLRVLGWVARGRGDVVPGERRGKKSPVSISRIILSLLLLRRPTLPLFA